LEQLVEQGEAGNSFDWQTAREILEFFRHFADQCHHAKEERHLFPALEAKGFSSQFGPTGVMRDEHELGRRHISAMAEAVAAGQNEDSRGSGRPVDRWPSSPAARFAASARAYVSLLREHINKEDHCLFPMAVRALTTSDQQSLLSAFEEVEHGPGTANEHQKYVDLANRLADQFGVPKSVASTTQTVGCCGHR
jgi:hemerythrin-like domain-containing protein